MRLTGGEVILEVLKSEKVPFILGIPGHGCLGLFDAIRKYDLQGDIKYIQVKHEQTATHIADGYYRIAGKPLAVFASIGPGAMNTVIGLSTSYVDSTAMLVLTGDTHTYMKGVGVLQEIERYQDSNFIKVMEPIAKRAWRMESTSQIPRTIKRAFSYMNSGRPGPVVLAIPMDIQADSINVRKGLFLEKRTPNSRPCPDENIINSAVKIIKSAKRPVILLGGGALRAEISHKLTILAERWGAAVISTMAGKSAFPEGHPQYCFHTGSKGTTVGLHFARNADVVLALGTRFADETTCSYRKSISFNFPETKLIHVDIDPAEVGKNYNVDVGIVADVEMTVDKLLEKMDLKDNILENYFQEIQKEKLKWFSYIETSRSKNYDKITISQLIGSLNKVLPKNTIVATSSGNTQAQIFQEYIFEEPYTHLTTGGFSTMGWAVPAAIGAKLAKPDTPVVAVVGDGDFMMIMQELATLAQYDIPIVIILANNNGWLAIQDLQQDAFGEEYKFGTVWEKDGKSYTPDFVQIAKSFKIDAIRVKKLDEIGDAITRALALKKPVLVEVEVTDKYPESGGKAFGWWDVPVPEYIQEKHKKYVEAKKEEQV